MNMDRRGTAARLLACIGEINDSFLEEAESADIASDIAAHSRFVRYGKLAAAASLGLAVTYWLLRSRRPAVSIKNIPRKKSA
ncbi:MAG: hypothetical protein FWE20_04820 [Defluviitaleaceae bacterium]|nr:hypothetical protein [Defluviitaleaceae bacterium]